MEAAQHGKSSTCDSKEMEWLAVAPFHGFVTFFLTSSSIADWTTGAKIPDRPYSEQAWSSNIDQHPNIPADELIAGNAFHSSGASLHEYRETRIALAFGVMIQD